jgi:hypothetical protein
MAACGGADREQEQVRTATERFVEAFRSGDAETLRELAPDLASAEPGLGGRGAAFAERYPQWHITGIELHGSRATARVQFTNDERSLTLRVPFRKQESARGDRQAGATVASGDASGSKEGEPQSGTRWTVSGDIRATEQIDVVPLTPDESPP